MTLTTSLSEGNPLAEVSLHEYMSTYHSSTEMSSASVHAQVALQEKLNSPPLFRRAMIHSGTAGVMGFCDRADMDEIWRQALVAAKVNTRDPAAALKDMQELPAADLLDLLNFKVNHPVFLSTEADTARRNHPMSFWTTTLYLTRCSADRAAVLAKHHASLKRSYLETFDTREALRPFQPQCLGSIQLWPQLDIVYSAWSKRILSWTCTESEISPMWTAKSVLVGYESSSKMYGSTCLAICFVKLGLVQRYGTCMQHRHSQPPNTAWACRTIPWICYM